MGEKEEKYQIKISYLFRSFVRGSLERGEPRHVGLQLLLTRARPIHRVQRPQLRIHDRRTKQVDLSFEIHLMRFQPNLKKRNKVLFFVYLRILSKKSLIRVFLTDRRSLKGSLGANMKVRTITECEH